MSFEPMAEVFAALATNIAVNDLSGFVTPVLSALGSNISVIDVPSLQFSLDRVSNSGQTALGKAAVPAGADRRDVLPLDAFSLSRLDLIKIGEFLAVSIYLAICVCQAYARGSSNES
jgi:hypothetical protein